MEMDQSLASGQGQRGAEHLEQSWMFGSYRNPHAESRVYFVRLRWVINCWF